MVRSLEAGGRGKTVCAWSLCEGLQLPKGEGRRRATGLKRNRSVVLQ